MNRNKRRLEIHREFKRGSREFSGSRKSSGADRDSNKRNAVRYFTQLNGNNLLAENFKRQWDAMLDGAPNFRELTILLHCTAKNLRSQQSPWEKSYGFLFECLRRWEEESARNIKTFDPQALNASLWSFSVLRVKPSDSFINKWENQALRVIHDFSPANLAVSLWACAALGVSPSREFLAAWRRQARSALSSFDEHERGLSLWALAVINVLTGDDIRSEAEVLYGSHNIQKNCGIAYQQQTADAARWFDLKDLPAFPKRESIISISEQRLMRVFAEAGLLMCEEDKHFNALSCDIDIAFRAGPQRFLVEADGIFHFNHDYDGCIAGYNGHTQLKSALLRKFAPDAMLIRVRYPESEAIISNPSLLRGMMLASVKKEPDAYETYTMDDGSIGLRPHLRTIVCSPEQTPVGRLNRFERFASFR